MKSYNHLYEQIISEENLKLAVKNAIKGRKKKRRKQIKRYMDDIDGTARKLKKWIENYHNDYHVPIEIYDGITRKKREIIVPTFKELAVQHAIIQVMRPVFLNGAYEHSYAATPGKGAHLGKKYLERWIRNDQKNCKYVLKIDIKKFFPSIPHDILKVKLSKKIRDKRLLELLFEIISVTDHGIPLGFYTSQWLSNWYLMSLDHYIKEDMRVRYYMRFMDDMVLLGSNKRELHKVRENIEAYLSHNLGLELKGNWQLFRFIYIKGGKVHGRDIDFMGFRFFRERTTMRRSIMLKATKTARKISNKDKPSLYDLRRMLSYLGWITHADVYGMYIVRIKPFVNFQYCKRRLSAHDRREAKNDIILCAAGG